MSCKTSDISSQVPRERFKVTRLGQVSLRKATVASQ